MGHVRHASRRDLPRRAPAARLRVRDPLYALACVFLAACSRKKPSPNQTLPAALGASSESLSSAANDDGAASEACRESGACERGTAGCQPSHLEHCLESAGCRRDGKCRLSNDSGRARPPGTFLATDNVGCAASRLQAVQRLWRWSRSARTIATRQSDDRAESQTNRTHLPLRVHAPELRLAAQPSHSWKAA
jgi:hypothetical protein